MPSKLKKKTPSTLSESAVLSGPDERYRAPALDKGLDILELLAQQPQGLTRAEIVKEMDRSASEIYRMLERLVARQYVTRSLSGDRYALSLKLFALANIHPPLNRLINQALPVMDAFARQAEQSCHLGVYDRGNVLITSQINSPRGWSFSLHRGARVGLLDTASGHVLLAAVIAYQAGILTIGPLDRILDTRKWIAAFGTAVVACIMGTLALWHDAPSWLPVAAIVAIGFVSASSTMVMAHARSLFPDRLIGRGMATVNATVMLGVACMQTLSGVILGQFAPLASGARSDIAYRSLFGFMAVVLIVAVSVYSRAPDAKPSAGR